MTTIIEIDCTPIVDPYHRDTGELTRTYLEISPEYDTVAIVQRYNDGTTPSHQWHGLDLTYQIDVSEGYLRDDTTRAYLQGADAQALLAHIRAGWGNRWDGNNYIGHINDDAELAVKDLLASLWQIATREYCLWPVDDWCSSVEIDGNESDERLAEIALELRQALGPDEAVNGDILDYLTRERDDARSR